ncbi:glucose 1-dehydrogenase [Pseudonocardia kongjuensis]|uniref:Glucose 1-dehydrogenase n=1 Tax=Pseudonocardia kongjuensis TaxID=102227 RepID=A0ABP4ICW8_9PSEU
MSARLSGKSVIISGAAHGIGAAQARLFAREGARLALFDIDGEGVAKLAAELVADGHRVVHTTADVVSEDDWIRVVALAEDELGGLHALSNNAGIFRPEGVEETTVELFNTITAINQLGVILGMKTAIPALRRAGGGSIVNFSSIYGLTGSGLATAYQGTKGAVRLITKTAAVQYAPEAIRVNSVHPTMIDTPLIRNGVPENELRRLLKLVPMQRIGQADEVAHAALFLLSDEASLITGAELAVDGGYTAGAPIPD